MFDWLITRADPWVAAAILLAASAAVAVMVRRRAWRRPPTRRDSSRSEEAFDPTVLVVARGFSIEGLDTTKFARRGDALAQGDSSQPESVPPPDFEPAVELSLAELDEARLLGLCGFPLPEQISQVQAGALSMLPRLDAAIGRPLLRRRLDLALRLAASRPDDPNSHIDVADSHRRLGDAALALGERAEAETHFESAIAIAEPLSARDPDREIWHALILFSLIKLSWLAETRGSREWALVYLGRAESTLDAMVRRDPSRSDLAEALTALLAQGRREREADPDPPGWAEPKPDDPTTFSGLLESFFDL